MVQLTQFQKDLQARAGSLSDGHVRDRAMEIDRTEEYPWDTVEMLSKAGFMGMTIPKAFGGAGLSYLDAMLVIEQLSRNCGVTGRIVVEANMGAISMVMAFGSQAQKEKVAPYILAGDKMAICITEPAAGSAATDMTTVATRTDGGYVLNGTKYWITGGGVSRVYLVLARVMENGQDMGIGGFLAFREETEGLRMGEREPTMGLRGMPERYVHFDDMFVSDDMVLQLPGGFRRGFPTLMTAYNSQRVGAATVALGIAQGAYEIALEYTKKREQFGRPIAEFQGLQWMLADMSISITASRALLHNAAINGADGFPSMLEAAQAKVLASETAVKVSNDALQLHGAMGYSRNLPLERMVRDARMFPIGGGTAQLLRNQVASSILDMKFPQTRDGYVGKTKDAA
ncbi:MAG: 3-sulfinopropanoyl-CoA desulfinase [Alphaproteobacteria bacterium]